MLILLVAGALIFAPFAFGQAAAKARFEPSDELKVPGIGVRQRNLTPEMLHKRERGIIEALKFNIATQPKVLEDVERVTSDKLQRVFATAAERTGIDAHWLEADAFLESGGKSDAQSPTGPVGLFQFTVAAGLEEGLVKREWVTKQVKVKVRQGKKKRTQIRLVKFLETTQDLRKELQASADAAGRRWARMMRMYGGRLDWAIEAHHAGPGNIAQWIRVYSGYPRLPESQVGEVIRSRELSYSKFFFSCSPVWRESLYYLLRTRMTEEGDFSPTYFFRVQAALELLQWYRQDEKGLREFVKQNKNKYKPNLAARYRMYAWFDEPAFFLKTLDDLKKIEGKEVFRVPDQPNLLGFFLRRLGPYSIAQSDPSNQDHYLFLAQAATGLLESVSYDFRELCEAYRATHRGAPACPALDVTALSRDLGYQGKLAEEVSNARTGWPTHATTLAFDISYLPLWPVYGEILQFVLRSYEWMGLAGYVKEYSYETFHVVPSPQSKDFFRKVYQEASEAVAMYGEPEFKRRSEVAIASKKSRGKIREGKVSAKKGPKKQPGAASGRPARSLQPARKAPHKGRTNSAAMHGPTAPHQRVRGPFLFSQA